MPDVFQDERLIIGGDRRQPIDAAAMRHIRDELEGFVGEPIERIAERWWAGREEAERLEHEALARASDTAAINAFYAATDRYLYELAYWEAQRDKQREFKKLWLAGRRFGWRRVLDFGGGVGGLSLYLSPRGIVCDYLDIPGKTFDFARYRFERRGTAVRMWGQLEDLPPATFDAIVSYDVFEHLFDLEGTCRRLRRSLAPGGWLVSKPTFSGDGAHLEKNFQYADMRAYNRMLADCGFVYRGRLKPGWRSEALRWAGRPYTVVDIRVSPLVKYGGNFLLHQVVG